jgi:hypothetical protein
VVSDAPPGLVAVINKLLAKRPEERYASASETAAALEQCLSAIPASARTASHRRRWVAGACALLLVAGAIAWGINQRNKPTSGAREVAAAPVQPEKVSLDLDGFVRQVDALRKTIIPPPATREVTLLQTFVVGDLVVTELVDEEKPGTLRWAVAEANNRNGENTITFDHQVFTKPMTIKLERGPLVLADSGLTTIIGPPTGLTISGNDKSQVFVIGSTWDQGNPAKVAISDLTIAHGRSRAEVPGGGGILCQGGSHLTLTGCTLIDNFAMHNEGGGGAIYNGHSTVVLTNCTLTRNQATEAGAIKNYAGVLKATNCTMVDNSAQHATGGVYTLGYNKAQTEVNNCIFANNGGSDVYLFDGRELTGDYNISRDGSAPGAHSLTNTNALLGPLGRNGGPTETFPLLTGSPAIDAGSQELVPADLKADQRGMSRIHNGKVDIGAYEAR